MKSKWAHVKEQVLAARKEGASMNEIEATFGVPKATQNFWFRKVRLSRKSKEILEYKKRRHLIEARKKAVEWHNGEKAKRMDAAKLAADETLSKINPVNRETLELALSILYLGEGFKTRATGMGNTDPLILKLFLGALVGLYNTDPAKMRFNLHLRADQDPLDMKIFWSEKLQIPKTQFKGISIDKRTVGKNTHAG